MEVGNRWGVSGMILGLLAIAIPVLWPDKKWVGWVCLAAALVVMAIWLWLEIRSVPRSEKVIRRIAACTFLGLVFISCVILMRHSSTRPPSINTGEEVLNDETIKPANGGSSGEKNGLPSVGSRTKVQAVIGAAPVPTKTRRPGKGATKMPLAAQSFDDAEVRSTMARRLSELSNDYSKIAAEREEGESALPIPDPDVPEGKSNIPYMNRQIYYYYTKGLIHSRRLDSRCNELIYAVSNRTDLGDELDWLRDSCAIHEGTVVEVKRAADFLAILAQRVLQPPKR